MRIDMGSLPWHMLPIAMMRLQKLSGVRGADGLHEFDHPGQQSDVIVIQVELTLPDWSARPVTTRLLIGSDLREITKLEQRAAWSGIRLTSDFAEKWQFGERLCADIDGASGDADVQIAVYVIDHVRLETLAAPTPSPVAVGEIESGPSSWWRSLWR